METALADSVCYGLESPDARMSCFFNKVVFFFFSHNVMKLMWLLTIDHGCVGFGESWQ